MDIRKRKIRGYFALSALIIILSLCLAMALPCVSEVAPSEVAYAAVTPGTASVLNLTEKGVAQDNFSSVITGGQNEYIYFGSNVTDFGNKIHTGAIKWRVLSAKDSKYSDRSSMLLWADYQLGSEKYNCYSNNQNYAYYGTSMIRAKLNGGMYLSTVSNTTAEPKLDQQVRVADSWLHKLFGENERASIVAAKSYESKCWSFISNKFATTNIVGTGDGQYNSTNIGNANTAGSYASVSGTSVIETIPEGDSLFLLDYYDINNADYGFSDNGTTYANKVNASWTEDSAWYPSYYDNSGSKIGDYLKFSGDITGAYWLRPAGLDSTAVVTRALRVDSSGYVGSNYVATTYGVRPAFNLSPANVIYATAASVSSNNSTFASVKTVSTSDGKPAYKVYIKTDDYVNYNESTSNGPSISTTNNSVTVKKAGQSGSAIFLLADKSGSGVVEYQATASFDSNGVATANLPSDVKANDYVITVLFADSINGENYAESITGSFTTSGLSIPKAISVDYNGNIQTLETLKSDIDWYNSAFADPSIVEVKYLTSTGSELRGDNLPKNKGNYKIQLKILQPEDYSWGDSTGESDVTRTIDFEIVAKKLSVDFKVDNTASPPTA
ncbi:MAG: hypothetical protein K2O95_05315, partial [Clostridia bacterium]|nr:hypothetical protein [Clostridia bacterium]